MRHKLLNILITIIFFIYLLYIVLNISFTTINKHKFINITYFYENSNHEIELPLGSNLLDLLNQLNLDINNKYSISNDYVLYNGQYIDLNNNIDLVSINSDDINVLTSLKGIGVKTAQKIIEYRQTYGDFKSIEDIKNVKGIGDKKYESIKEFISI